MWVYILTGVPVFLYLLWKLLTLYYTRNDGFWPKRGVPLVLVSEIPGGWKSLIGQVPLHKVDQSYYNKYPDAPFVGVMEHGNPILLIKDPELVKKMTVKDFDHFVNRRIINFGGKLSQHFLFNMQGSRWKSLRSVLTPTFTSGKMRRMFEHFEKSSRELAQFVQGLKKGEVEKAEKQEDHNVTVIEAGQVFGRFAMDVIGSTAFGIDSQCLTNKNSPFYKQGTIFQKVELIRGLKMFCILLFPKFSRFLGLSFLPEKTTNFFTEIIARTLAARRENYEKVKNGGSKHGAAPSDFLQLMIEAQRQELKEENEEKDDLADFERDAKIQIQTDKSANQKIQITDTLILANSFTFFIAGFDSTEAILSVAAYHLALFPEYQERLREEVDQIVAEHDGKVTYDGVVKMTYLDMFISECLRLYPPATRFERKVTQEYKIPKIGDYPEVTLPLGTLVAFSVFAFHRDPKYWPNPDVFDPEHFNAENKAKRHPYVYMPFGLGPRSCIAMRFVLTELKAAVAHLVHEFEIRTCKETTIPLKLQELLGQHRPAADLKLGLLKRS